MLEIDAAPVHQALKENREHLIAQNIANNKKKVEKPDPNVSVFNFHYATPPDTVGPRLPPRALFSVRSTGLEI